MRTLLLTLLVLVPAAPALVATLLGSATRLHGAAGRIATMASGLAALGAAGVLAGVLADGPLHITAGADGQAWVGLTADRATAVIALLAALVGLVVQSYAQRALEGDVRAWRFAALASGLTAATTLVAYAGTLWLLAIGWIATSWSLVALLRHRTGWDPARRTASRAGRAFAVGDGALVAAVLVWWSVVGHTDLARGGPSDAAVDTVTALDQASGWPVAPVHLVGVLLLIAGVCRSALVPMHRWLPSTVTAPTPVSALLHAGVINGLGVLAIRTADVMGASSFTMTAMFVVGVSTAVLASSVMLVRPDVKGGLAWSTAGQMGFMAVQLAVGAFAAALFHIVGHAMYKASLFLGAGGAVSAHGASLHRAHPRRTMATAPASALSVVVAIATTTAALLVVDPHLSTAGTVLLVVFGSWSTSALLRGWLRSTPVGPASAATGLAGAALASFAYVGGIALFEHAVAPAVPFSVPGEVSAGVLVPVLGTIALVGLAVTVAPGGPLRLLRDRLIGALIGFGAPPVVRSRRARLGPVGAAANDRAPVDSTPRLLTSPSRS